MCYIHRVTEPAPEPAPPIPPTASREPDGTVESAEPTPPARKLTLKERLTAHFAEYGRVAVITYLVISLLTIVGFSVAIGIGAQPSTATGVFGVIGAGWLAAKATMPIRILIVLGITPVISAVVQRRRQR